MKRLLDIVVSCAALLLLSPILLLVGVAVRLDSPGPALFRQQRVGLHGRPFDILKFRSMRVTADGPQITAGGDRRVTRVGAWLRRTKIDELPQLFNVLRGEMSLVGPRPEVARYVALYPADARTEVFSVRPGITDDAAIEFRDEEQLLARADDPEQAYVEQILPRKIDLYRQYVRCNSIGGDLRVLWRTARAILGRSAGPGGRELSR